MRIAVSTVRSEDVTDAEHTDAETDMRDGLLSNIQPAHIPTVFHTNSSYEYCGLAASLSSEA